MSEIELKPLGLNIYFEIISFLSQNGLFKKVPINGILNKYFTYKEYETDSEKDGATKNFLDKMVYNKHIEYHTVLIKENRLEVDLVYLCGITIEGLMFHSLIQENTSTITTNKALVESFKASKYFALVAIIISSISLFATIYISSESTREDKLIQIMSSQNKQIEQMLKQLSITKNPLSKPIKDK